MNHLALRRLTLFGLLLMGAIVFALGIDWGLPSLDNNALLTGERGQYLEQAALHLSDTDLTQPADVVFASPDELTKPVPLNDTLEKQARILCRYRLYSQQPDEMIAFRAMARINPAKHQFDPQLYQYGGLWIYPIGAIIEAGSKLGLLNAGDREYYLANPDMFGRFYIIARAYSALWGLIGVGAVFYLTRRMTGGIFLPAVAAALYIVMPAVVDLSHEAKPHLAGSVLILLSVLAAGRFLETGKTRWAIATGFLCGTAGGMVLWAAVSIAIIPMMAIRARASDHAKLTGALVAALVAILAFAIFNPYLVYHLFNDPSVLRANLGNTAGMYHPTLGLDGIRLLVVGTSPLLLVAGLLGIIACGLTPRPAAQGAGLLLAAPATLLTVGFILLAGAKPGEYARFAILPDIALIIAAVVGLSRLKLPLAVTASVSAVLWLATALFGSSYLRGFINDHPANPQSTRAVCSDSLEKIRRANKRTLTLGVYSDPAPYCLPPVDLIHWNIVHLPPTMTPDTAGSVADVIVRPDDSIDPLDWRQTPMSWAEKEFSVYTR